MTTMKEVDQLWEEYFKNKDIDTRNEIALKYEDFVKMIVNKLKTNLPPGSFTKEDLLQNGMYALIQAIEVYDPTKGAAFKTFATIKVQGYIIDQIRYYGKSGGGPSRTSRKKMKEIEQTIEELEQKLNRNPTPDEISKEMGITVDKYYKILSNVKYSTPISLDENIQDTEVSLFQMIKSEMVSSPEEECISNEESEYFIKSFQELPLKEKIVIDCYFYRKMKIEKIAEYMNLTSGRASQLKKTGVNRLRDKMKEYRS